MFSDWNSTKAGETIPTKNKANIEANFKFYHGDHWQGGAGWSGPMLDSGSAGYSTMIDNVCKGFVAQNAIGEVTDRHVSGVVGDAVNKFVELKRPLSDEPTEAEQALLDEAAALLSLWWNGRRGVRLDSDNRLELCTPQETIQTAVRTLLLAKRSPLRLAISPSLLQTDEEGNTKLLIMEPEEAIQHLRIQHPDINAATVAIDSSDLSEAGVYVYKDGRESKAELSYLDDKENTVLRIVAGDAKDARDYTLNLAGNLTMHEMNRDLFITETITRLQKSLNLVRTNKSRNDVTAGFLEREYFNARMPGNFVVDESAPGGKKFVPDKMTIGPNAVNFYQGLPIYDERGKITGYTTPSSNVRQPVSSEPLIKSLDADYIGILHEARQMHVLAPSMSGASGEFIIQARADYRDSLKVTKTAVDGALTWLFETVLHMAAALSGNPGKYDSLKVSGAATINTGPLSISEKQVIISAAEKGQISKETTIRLLGVENVSAELARIEAEAENSLSQLQMRANIIKTLTDTNQVGVMPAALVAGIDEADAQQLAETPRFLAQDQIDEPAVNDA